MSEDVGVRYVLCAKGVLFPSWIMRVEGFLNCLLYRYLNSSV